MCPLNIGDQRQHKKRHSLACAQVQLISNVEGLEGRADPHSVKECAMEFLCAILFVGGIYILFDKVADYIEEMIHSLQ